MNSPKLYCMSSAGRIESRKGSRVLPLGVHGCATRAAGTTVSFVGNGTTSTVGHRRFADSIPSGPSRLRKACRSIRLNARGVRGWPPGG